MQVFILQTSCQDAAEEEDADEEDAELDSMLIESAGDLLPSVAKVVGGDSFKPYFAGFLPELIKKTVGTGSRIMLTYVDYFMA